MSTRIPASSRGIPSCLILSDSLCNHVHLFSQNTCFYLSLSRYLFLLSSNWESSWNPLDFPLKIVVNSWDLWGLGILFESSAMVGEFSKLVGKRRIVVKEEDCLFSDLKEEESETVFIYFSKMNGQRGRSRKSLSLSNSSSQGKKKDLEDGSSDAGRKLSTSSHSGYGSCSLSSFFLLKVWILMPELLRPFVCMISFFMDLNSVDFRPGGRGFLWYLWFCCLGYCFLSIKACICGS